MLSDHYEDHANVHVPTFDGPRDPVVHLKKQNEFPTVA